MKRAYVLLVALLALAFSPEAAAQTTTWTGSGDGDPIIALQWEGEADTVTATASGYEFTVSATDTDGAGGAAGLTDVAPQDWTFTVEFGTDLQTAANGGYVLCGIWAGEVTSGDFWADQPRQIWVEFEAGGDYTAESDSPTSVNDSITVTADPGTMSFRLSQSGDTITMEYTEPGSTTFLTLGTDDALTTATDFGVIMLAYAGAGFNEDATILIETVTLTLAEAPPPPPPPISISGAGHRLLVGQDLDLAVDAGEIEPTAYQWAKDGEDLEGETGATLSILSVVEDDTGDYSCLVTYEEEGGDAAYAEAEPSYYVWVTESALPLAGGLGLGLLAGACALAGVGSIRRKK